jgi:hypothetical protein
MTAAFVRELDQLSTWREQACLRVDALSQYLEAHDLVDAGGDPTLMGLRRRLENEKLVVAFVAEFSRGKSELINAIFFADLGQRVMPAAPGRTTMCPVELGFDPQAAPALALLPIATRLKGVPLSELRNLPKSWTHMPLDAQSPDLLKEALSEVTRTQWVGRQDARDLGFWDDARPHDNPPQDANGRVEVPVWRHALINYPHPLLKQGLVVLDTPGLNALGAEPELTLGLLPSAHATVFILGADTGVTHSDMEIWRDHLGAHAMARFVVLNKIDALADPLASAVEVARQITAQQESTAQVLNISTSRVFPLSARQALSARVLRDEAGLQASRLPALEAALAEQLMPQRRAVLSQSMVEVSRSIESLLVRRLSESRRQLAEQTLELRGLRGKNSGKVGRILERVRSDVAEFEMCTGSLQAMRTVHSRLLKDLQWGLSSDRLREELLVLQRAFGTSVMKWGAKKAFAEMCMRLRGHMAQAQVQSTEIREMLAATFLRLNADYGFALMLPDSVALDRYQADLDQIENSYVQYLGLSQAYRLSQPRFMEQFCQMLLSKLRVVFETACAELELWNKNATAQVDAQLRERRLDFRSRYASLERIQLATGELEARLTEVEAIDAGLQEKLSRVRELTRALQAHAAEPPSRATALDLDLDLDFIVDRRQA